jgi:spermidine synthase
VVPRILIDTAAVPDGGELRLFRRGDEFSIMLGANELMNSRLSGSEEALAGLACDRLVGTTRSHFLIGGLGMGFTLRAALARLGAESVVTVAELVPAVIAWARGPMTGIFAGCLDDPRVRIATDDVAGLIWAGSSDYDAILLDVDNGPDGLSRESNGRLYSANGLAAARRALRPGGVLAIWSAAPDRGFTRRLGEAGYAVDEAVARGRAGGRGARHVIWLAKKPA